MRWSLRVVTGLTADTEPCVLIRFEQPPASYILNVGEGTNRAFIQRLCSIAQTKAVFLSDLSPQLVGGFPGIVMSLFDMDRRGLTVCGPPGLAHYVASTRYYTKRPEIGLVVRECSATSTSGSSAPPTPIFEDERLKVFNVTISATPLSPISNGSSSGKRKRSQSPLSSPSRRRLSTPEPVSERESFNMTVASLEREIDPEAHTQIAHTIEDAQAWRNEICRLSFNDANAPADFSKTKYYARMPEARFPITATSYVFIGPSARGKFDNTKALLLGVPPGPSRGRLSNGETIITTAGRTVTPDMVVGPSSPPTAFIYVNCPDPSFIDNIVNSNQLKASFYDDTVITHAVIHRTGHGVIEDPRYQAWMSSFDSSTLHLVGSEEYSSNPVVYTSSANLQLKLSHLDSDVFRIPKHNNKSARHLSDLISLPPKTTELRQDAVILMQPPSDLQIAAYLPPDDFERGVQDVTAEKYQSPQEKLYKQAQENVAIEEERRGLTKVPGNDVIIHTLGTGSAMPSKYRNVSCTLVQIPNWGNMMLDCGEGAWGQLARHFSEAPFDRSRSDDPLNQFLKELKCIFISHIHGDHHMSLPQILSRRRSLQLPAEDTLYLIADHRVLQYLDEYNDLHDLGYWDSNSIRRIRIANIHYERKAPELPTVNKLKAALGLESIQSVDVAHRTLCSGLVFRHVDGWSLTYSGDTMPTTKLVEAGKGSTVLIHEATLADEEADMALAKAHSTFGQALDIGKQMEARNILLTHFSQRYPKMPDLQQHDAVTDESFGPLEGSSSSLSLIASRAPVAIAFDGASLRIGSLWKMEKYMEAITQTLEAQETTETDEVVLLSSGTIAATPLALQKSTTSAGPKKKVKKITGTAQ